MGASLTISRAAFTDPNSTAVKAMINKTFCASPPEPGRIKSCNAVLSPPRFAAYALPFGLFLRKSSTRSHFIDTAGLAGQGTSRKPVVVRMVAVVGQFAIL